VSWVVCNGGAALDNGFSLFLPQPAANIAAPTTSARQETPVCANLHPADRAEPENIFINYEVVAELLG
jgi:hypothetical protein